MGDADIVTRAIAWYLALAYLRANGVTLVSLAYNRCGGPTALTDALGYVRQITYDENTFLPVAASDMLGALGGYTWNAQGSPLTQTNGAGETTILS